MNLPIKFLMLFLISGCELVSENGETEVKQARSAPENKQLRAALEKLIPPTATSSAIIEAGQEAQISDETQKLSIGFPANSFTEFVVVAVEPVVEAEVDVLSAAAFFQAPALTENRYENPTLVHGFKLSVVNTTSAVNSALDLSICHEYAAYNANKVYVIVITPDEGERISIPASLSEGSASQLCFSTIHSNATFHLISLDVIAADIDPPSGLTFSFTVTPSDLITGSALMTLLEIDDAVQIAASQGTACPQESISWQDIDLVSKQHSLEGLVLNGEVNENLSVSVLVRDASGNASKCVTLTQGFENSIAIAQANAPSKEPQQVDTQPPAVPTGIINPESVFENSFEVSWGKNSELDLAAYNLKMCTEGQTCRECQAKSIEIKPMDDPKAVVTGIAENTPLFACVQAVDQAQNFSEWARSASSTTFLANNLNPYIKKLGKFTYADLLDTSNMDLTHFLVRDEANHAFYVIAVTQGHFVTSASYVGDDHMDLIALKFTYKGDLIWANQLTNISGAGFQIDSESARGALVDSSGDLIVVGVTAGDLLADPQNPSIGINSDHKDDPFVVKFSGKDGSVLTLSQFHQEGDQEASGIIEDGYGDYYLAILDIKSIEVTENTDKGPVTTIEERHYISFRKLNRDLKTFPSNSFVTPNLRVARSYQDSFSIETMQLNSSKDLIVGLSTAANMDFQFCQNGAITQNTTTNWYESTAIDETACTAGGGQWIKDSNQTPGRYEQQNIDAIVLKISTQAASLGQITHSHRIGPDFTNAGHNRDSSGNEYILQALVDPVSDAIYIQGITNGSLAEQAGNALAIINGDPDSATDVFLARIDSDFNLSWLTHLGEDTIGKGEIDLSNFVARGNIGSELSFGALYQTDKGHLITSFASQTDYLQQSDPGMKVFSVFIAFDALDGSIKWKKQISPKISGEWLVVVSMDGDQFGNSFFTGYAFGDTVEESLPSGGDGMQTDVIYGVLGPEGQLDLP